MKTSGCGDGRRVGAWVLCVCVSGMEVLITLNRPSTYWLCMNGNRIVNVLKSNSLRNSPFMAAFWLPRLLDPDRWLYPFNWREIDIYDTLYLGEHISCWQFTFESVNMLVNRWGKLLTPYMFFFCKYKKRISIMIRYNILHKVTKRFFIADPTIGIRYFEYSIMS